MATSVAWAAASWPPALVGGRWAVPVEQGGGIGAAAGKSQITGIQRGAVGGDQTDPHLGGDEGAGVPAGAGELVEDLGALGRGGRRARLDAYLAPGGRLVDQPDVDRGERPVLAQVGDELCAADRKSTRLNSSHVAI